MRDAIAVATIAVATLLWATPASAVPLQVYFNDFDGTETFGSGATGGLSGITTTEGVQDYNGLGPGGNQFGGNLLRNFSVAAASTILTLNNLPPHVSIDIDFLLAIIDSWDSLDGAADATPDFFNVTLDSVSLLQHTYASASGTVTNTTGTDIGGWPVHRGFWSSYGDRAFDASTEGALTGVAHTGSTAVIELFASGAGWQGDPDPLVGDFDESWGIDNLKVTINAVPEPGTFLLLGIDLTGLVVSRKRSG